MHGLADIGPSVPAFLVKLWRLVEDEDCELINWSESGMTFIIQDQARFAREVLPMHYKHNNMASFIRQLNMYDFHKISSLESGSLRNERDELEFGHQYFIRDHPYLLENIKRKMPNQRNGVAAAAVRAAPAFRAVRAPPAPRAVPAAQAAPAPQAAPEENDRDDNARNGPQPDIFARLLSDVNVLKGKQDTWDARLSAMKRENEALWRELAVFRQKHLKQEQIINRLIHFIVTIVQPNRKVPIPRRFPLMLNDTQQIRKIPKVNSPNISSSRASPPGPTIHEIEGDILINGNEIRNPSGIGNESFISPSSSDSPPSLQIQDPEPIVKDPVMSGTQTPSKKGSSDWLEIVLTEDDMVTPLTPVDPAEVNPVVAAATLKQMENNNKITVPVTMKIPAIVTTDGNKRRIPEKKIIYLAEIDKSDKTKPKQYKPQLSKNELFKNKEITPPHNNTSFIETIDNSLDLIDSQNLKVSKTYPSKPRGLGKRKQPALQSLSVSESPCKRQNFESKPVAKAASEQYSPFPTPYTLDNLLNCNMIDANTTKDNAASKEQTAEDSFWRLESLYNDSLNVNGLITEETDRENPVDQIIEEVEDLSVNNSDKISEIDIPEVCTTGVESSKVPEKNGAENGDAAGNVPPESMAIVCQSSSPSNEDLVRELTAHVDSVQGEIDYLKELIKGDNYNFNMQHLFGYYNEDPLSYGLLQTSEDEPKEKQNDRVMGNEMITYGSQNNLMDLVDLFGTSSTVQDWSSVVTPPSPPVADLETPGPSPNPDNPSKSGKNRKI